MVGRSRQVFPICRQMLFMNEMILIWKSQGSDVGFGFAEPQEVNHRGVPIDPGVAETPAGDF